MVLYYTNTKYSQEEQLRVTIFEVITIIMSVISLLIVQQQRETTSASWPSRKLHRLQHTRHTHTCAHLQIVRELHRLHNRRPSGYASYIEEPLLRFGFHLCAVWVQTRYGAFQECVFSYKVQFDSFDRIIAKPPGNP